VNFKNIQGLRAVAVCFVLVAHIYGLFDKVVPRSHALDVLMALGHSGVDLFFVISGFIMISVHWSNFGDRGITRTFLTKRIVRIVPLYWLATLTIAAVFAIAPHLILSWPQTSLALSLLIVPMSREPLLFVGWTLVYEMYFYYIFAVLLNFSRRYAFVGLGIWAAIIALAQVWPERATTPVGDQYLSTLVFEFLLGIIVGTLVKRGVLRFSSPAISLGFLGLAGALYYVVTAHVVYAFDWNLRFLCYGVPMALILYGFVVLERERRFIMPRAMLRVGDASYSIYIWHTVIYAVFGHVLLVALRYVRVPWPILLCVPVITVLISLALYDLIEKPLLKVSRDTARRLSPVPTAAR